MNGKSKSKTNRASKSYVALRLSRSFVTQIFPIFLLLWTQTAQQYYTHPTHPFLYMRGREKERKGEREERKRKEGRESEWVCQGSERERERESWKRDSLFVCVYVWEGEKESLKREEESVWVCVCVRRERVEKRQQKVSPIHSMTHPNKNIFFWKKLKNESLI